MGQRDEHIDRLIARYFSGEALPEEAIELEEWIDLSHENRKYFEDFRYINSVTGKQSRYVRVDVHKAWENVSRQRRLKENTSPVSTKTITLLRRRPWIGVAATIAVLASLSVFLIVNRSDDRGLSTPVYLASNDSIVRKEFTPAIAVAVNRNTSLEYLADRSGKKNEIRLRGEAFFEVSHSEDTTLVVRADETFVRDIGTSFNIKAFPGDSTIEVTVEKGEVMFYTKELKGVSVKEQQTGVFIKATKVFMVKATTDPNIISYSTRHFVFRSNSLYEVTQMLNKVYSHKVTIADECLKDMKITVTFNDEPLDSIVDIIGETLGADIRRDSSGFVLYQEK